MHIRACDLTNLFDVSLDPLGAARVELANTRCDALADPVGTNKSMKVSKAEHEIIQSEM